MAHDYPRPRGGMTHQRKGREEVSPPWWFLAFILAVIVFALAYLFAWQSAEAGPPTRVFEALNETAGLTEWEQKSVVNDAYIDDSSLACHSIGRGIYVIPDPDGVGYAYANKHMSGGVHNHSFVYVNMGTLNTTGGATTNRIIIGHRTRGVAAAPLNISARDLGTTFEILVTAYDDDGVFAAAAPIDTFSLAEWYWIHCYEYSAAEPNGIYRVFVDGTQKWTADTLDTDGCKWDSLRVGILTPASSTSSGYLAFDDIVWDTTANADPFVIEPVNAEYGFPTGGF